MEIYGGKDKELGHGFEGTVFLVKINNKQYVRKIGRLPESDITPDLSKQFWREVEFGKILFIY